MAKGSSGLAAPVCHARRSPVNAGASWPAPKVAEARVLGIQRKLHKWASDDPNRRFNDLHNLVCDPATLMMAWHLVRSNRGSRSGKRSGRKAATAPRVDPYVRHEALPVRAGCKTLPPGCRGSPGKLRTV